MIPVPLQILAESEPITKFIGIAVVVVIWIVGLIAQAVKKQQEQAKQAPRREPELAEAIRNRLPPAKPVPPRLPKQKQKRQQPQRQKNRPDWQTIAAPPVIQQRTQPAPVPAIPEPRPRVFTEAPAASDEQPRKQTPFVGAAAVHRWLKPATLQQQFILTELMQKPMSERQNPF